MSSESEDADADVDAEVHEMREPTVEKVVVHMALGEGGRELARAEDILESVTDQESVRTQAGRAAQDFGVREGTPVGAKVTLRGDRAREFLETALPLADVSRGQFDDTGNFSFGVEEHTEFPSQEYDPEVGIYGLDVTVNLVRPGYRVSKRDKRTRQIPSGHRLTVEDAIAFLEREFDAEVNE